MLRRIRNFIFDIKDLIIVIAIVSVLFFAVTWKVNETLNIDLDGSGGVVVIDPGETQSPTQPSTQPKATEPTANASRPTTSPTPPTTSPNIAPPNTTAPNIAPPNTGTPNTGTPAPTTAPTPAPAPTAPQGESQLFVVTEGEYAQDIAVNLRDAGFITNPTDFVVRATELGVEGQLLVGRYQLHIGDDLDTIIRILSGGSR